MAGVDKAILVYDDFSSDAPILLGKLWKLYVGVIKGGESCSFEYDKEWLQIPQKLSTRVRVLMQAR